MLVDTLVEKRPAWLSEDAPEAAGALWSQVSLVRNLAEFPFPNRASEHEKQAVEERILGVLDQLNLLATGRYYALADLDATELRFLAERKLITHTLVHTKGPRGAYISDDQCMSIMVNGSDHLCVRVLYPGQQLQEVWSRLNLMDDTLGGALDFAYDKRLGYLTTDLAHAGTGVLTGALLHLPALVATGRLEESAEAVSNQDVSLHGVRAGSDPTRPVAMRPASEGGLLAPDVLVEAAPDQALYSDLRGVFTCEPEQTLGDLFMLTNERTLGVSEEEIVFHVRHAAGQLLSEEREARREILENNQRGLEDRVGRARGAASGARILGFAESIELLSSLRLGVSVELLPGHRLRELNELLLQTQGAHLEIARAQSGDGLQMSMERADLFQSRFS